MTIFKNSYRTLAIVGGFALLAACSSHNPNVATQQSSWTPASTPASFSDSFTVVSTSAGNVAATSRGMTLYTFDEDTRGSSNCYGACAVTWPPYLANSHSTPNGNMSVITRTDGRLQWAENGKPLYTYVDDRKPGDINGNGLRNTWHVVI